MFVRLAVQENTNLEEKVCVMQQKDEELKTLQDQIVYLEEIRWASAQTKI